MPLRRILRLMTLGAVLYSSLTLAQADSADPLLPLANRPLVAPDEISVNAQMGGDAIVVNLPPEIRPIETRSKGVASWYGRQFHGRKTASGERFNMYGLTAAHKTLPLMSYVRVSNPANGKSIVVRITDRGPFHSDRMIDLSYGAAQELGIRGLGDVEIDTVDRAVYESQTDETTISRDLREASLVPIPVRRSERRPIIKQTMKR